MWATPTPAHLFTHLPTTPSDTAGEDEDMEDVARCSPPPGATPPEGGGSNMGVQPMSIAGGGSSCAASGGEEGAERDGVRRDLFRWGLKSHQRCMLATSLVPCASPNYTGSYGTTLHTLSSCSRPSAACVRVIHLRHTPSASLTPPSAPESGSRAWSPKPPNLLCTTTLSVRRQAFNELDAVSATSSPAGAAPKQGAAAQPVSATKDPRRMSLTAAYRTLAKSLLAAGPAGEAIAAAAAAAPEPAAPPAVTPEVCEDFPCRWCRCVASSQLLQALLSALKSGIHLCASRAQSARSHCPLFWCLCSPW